MALPSIPSGYVGREYLRVGGGYGSAAAGVSPAGGLDVDSAGHLATDGDVTIAGKLSATSMDNVQFTGQLRASVGGVDKTWSRWIGATDIYDRNSPATLQLVEMYGGRVYAAAVTANATGQVVNLALPEDYDGSALKITYYWTATTGSSGDIFWHTYWNAFGDGQSMNVEGAQNNSVDTFLGQKYLHVLSNTGTPYGAATGHTLTLFIRRLEAYVLDTFDGTVLLIGIRLSYA